MSWSVDSCRSAITREIRSFSVVELNLNAHNLQVGPLHIVTTVLSHLQLVELLF